ncbi:hypothetical protein K466DRAFT_597857 [Polyporus arcularius HHB13444]|uniref:C2 domain-containing protein n=1 Tax=Polyporus arcularius HHB13444 TaxID=1314778 RepID=A0A5C3PJX6_9APHY|nr:hypothetical protein K466DRAFT_597857 [Polyporus arcularius HHB13444]
MAPAPKQKALKIGRALKRLPARVSGGRGNGGAFAPLPGEQPIVMLRVQVLSCTNLLAKDRNGSSDPYVSSLSLCLCFSLSFCISFLYESGLGRAELVRRRLLALVVLPTER